MNLPATPLSRTAQLRRRARHFMLFALLAAFASLPPYLWFAPLWTKVAALNGFGFILAAMGFGLLLVAGPLGFIACLLASLFMRIEACFAPGERPRGMADHLAIGGGLLLTFAPALGACYPAIKAIISGAVKFKFPAAQVLREVDPLGFWQGVTFWLMGAATLAVLAGYYWRSRWRQRNSAG